MRINIFCPHIWPDTAPTGDVMRQLLERWAGEGHECHVITSLPWYRNHRVQDQWRGVPWHRQRTEWGSVLRLHPCAPSKKTKSKSNLALRSVGFAAFGAYAAAAGLASLGRSDMARSDMSRSDVAFAMSPPLTLAAAAGLVAGLHHTPLVLNLQDLHPDAAIATQAIPTETALGRSSIAALRSLERFSYRRAAAITVLSEATRATVLERVSQPQSGGVAKRVEVIANFPTTQFTPAQRDNSYRRELGIDKDAVVFLYAGNLGYSQPLGLVRAAATQLASRRDVCFVINGEGAALGEVQSWAQALPNVKVAPYQPVERLGEVLAAADVHLVLLAAGLGNVSVPSKVYSAFSAARPVLAAAEPDSEISCIVETSAAGLSVHPNDEVAFVQAVRRLADDTAERAVMSAAAKKHANFHSADNAAISYLRLFDELMRDEPA